MNVRDLQIDGPSGSCNLPTRIVFLIYVDLLWPPEAETIKNRDSFIFDYRFMWSQYDDPGS